MLATYAKTQYQEMQVQTTPGKLIVMLYDGALRFLHMAVDALGRDDRTTAGVQIGKAQDIVAELLNSLDLSVGDLAGDLHAIYRYCLRRLLLANAENNSAYLEEVIAILQPLREAWDQAERTVRGSDAASSEAYLVGAGNR